MAAFHREVAKYFAKYAASTPGSTSTSLMAFTPAAPAPSRFRTALGEVFSPIWFRFFRGPLDRWNQAAIGKYLREQGLMYDDLYSDKEPVIERALELLPEDIATARYRRIMRATHLNHIRLYLPPHEQNYDPFIPYLAPYVEEAKFQLQEEEELLGYHMWDRRLYSGGCTGFGDFEPGMHFLVSFPNMYGGGSGPHNKAHLSSLARSTSRTK
ncbi:ubiquinol-cytochrome c reductase complex 14 kda [Cyclospora cayetanensis]|uniref:Ubiquinol-cytochrome c reductase complex 14 kDa n=1 Tax=Cyclospora cayetanensis TaxID=88456 RepID=A0A1D3CXK7_9EIME|nr:ubiquinol-cytochrome c reductase complex 14 kda [Cyclospora cayetanensis]